MVAHYQFEETSGTTLVDSSGNGYDGTVNNSNGTGSLNVSGPTGLGSAYRPGANATDDGAFSAAVAANYGISGNSARTVSLWFNSNNFGGATDQHRLFGMGSGSAGSFDIVAEAGNNAGGVARVGLRYGNGNVYYDSDNNGTAFSTGTWYHLVAVYDGTTLDLESVGTASDGIGLNFYVNGVLLDTAGGNLGNPAQALATIDTEGMRFGAQSLGGNNLYGGLLDDVQIYNEALSGAQVAYLFNNPGAVIPEPAAFGLTGLGLLLFLRRRR